MLLPVFPQLLVQAGKGTELQGAQAAAAQRAATDLAEAGLTVTDARTVMLILATQSAAFLAFGFALRRWRCRPGLEPSTLTLGRQLLLGLVYGVLALLGSMALSLLLSLLGAAPEEQPWVLDLAGRGDQGLLLVLVFAVLVAPVSEELLFRGYVYERLRQAGGVLMATVISSFLFAAIHGNPQALAIYLYLGMVLAVAYQQSGSVVTAAVAHAMNNTVAFSLLVATHAATQAS